MEPTLLASQLGTCSPRHYGCQPTDRTKIADNRSNYQRDDLVIQNQSSLGTVVAGFIIIIPTFYCIYYRQCFSNIDRQAFSTSCSVE